MGRRIIKGVRPSPFRCLDNDVTSIFELRYCPFIKISPVAKTKNLQFYTVILVLKQSKYFEVYLML